MHADAVVSAVGAEHADKFGEHPFFHLAMLFCLPPCLSVYSSFPCPLLRPVTPGFDPHVL